MTQFPTETSERREPTEGRISLIGVAVAFVLTIILVFALFGLVGYPQVFPLSFGIAIVLVEVGEQVIRKGSGGLTPRWFGRALVDGIFVAGGCWLGVLIAQWLGLMG